MNKSLTKGSIFECPIGPSCHRSFHMDQPSPVRPRDRHIQKRQACVISYKRVGLVSTPDFPGIKQKHRIMILLRKSQAVGFKYWRIFEKHTERLHVFLSETILDSNQITIEIINLGNLTSKKSSQPSIKNPHLHHPSQVTPSGPSGRKPSCCAHSCNHRHASARGQRLGWGPSAWWMTFKPL